MEELQFRVMVTNELYLELLQKCVDQGIIIKKQNLEIERLTKEVPK